ncbi:uncharacterized protein [Ptychodera flava]|uniref:uncharacterized protein n=1 Tax=Ptychodera flava TaxID=63121 RepID=UPI00396A9091
MVFHGYRSSAHDSKVRSVNMKHVYLSTICPVIFALLQLFAKTTQEHISVNSDITSQVEVLARTIPQTVLTFLNRYVSNYLYWDFRVNQFEQFTFHDFESSLLGNETQQHDRSMSPWTVRFPIRQFRRTNTWKLLSDQLLGRTGEIFYLREVKTVGVWKTDQTLKHSCASADENDVFMFVFLNTNWEKNDYGELQLHGLLGVDKVVHPKPGRIVFASCKTTFIIKPPSMASSKGLKVLVVRATRAEELSEKSEADETGDEEDFKKRLSENEKDLPAIFLEDVKQFEPAEHLVRRYSLNSTTGIHIFDDVLDNSVVEALVNFVIANATYQENTPDDGSDNVYWISGYPLDVFVRTNIWKVTQQLVKYISGQEGFMPYDVSCNLIRVSDHSKIHIDCSHSVDEFTVLFYLNKDWKVEYNGETVFFDDDYEPILAIKPKYGRIAVFNCGILHSARPPSSLVNGARYTFAVKVSRLEKFQTTDDVHDDVNVIREFLEDASEDEMKNVDVAAVEQLLKKVSKGTASKQEVEQCLKMFEDREKEDIFRNI